MTFVLLSLSLVNCTPGVFLTKADLELEESLTKRFLTRIAILASHRNSNSLLIALIRYMLMDL